MRLRSGALAGAVALAATVNPKISLAEPACTGRNEIMTLKFAEIQQELKVAGAECRAAGDYHRFVHAYKPALELSDQAMLSVFRANAPGDTGVTGYAAFKAELVSSSLLRSARSKAQFCAEARSEFSAAFSGSDSLETLINSAPPYVDIPFKDCGVTNPAPAGLSPAIVAEQSTSPSVARQNVVVAQAMVAPAPLGNLSVRPDPFELVRVVPHHAPVVPAVPAMTSPSAPAALAPQVAVATPPASPVQIARVVPHHAIDVPAVPAMRSPLAPTAHAPQFAVATPPSPAVQIARVVPHDAPVVPAVPAMASPSAPAAQAPHISVSAPPAPAVQIARVVPHHTIDVPALPSLSHPASAAVSAPHVAIEAPPVEMARVIPHHRITIPHLPAMMAPHEMAVRAPHIAIARLEYPEDMTLVVPSHIRIRPALPRMLAPREAEVAPPQIQIARVTTPPPQASDTASSVARELARLSAVAASMIREEGAAQAAERPAHARPMVAMVDPAPRPSVSAEDDSMADAAAAAADVLRARPDLHPQHAAAPHQPLHLPPQHQPINGTITEADVDQYMQGQAMKPATPVANADQAVVVPTRPVHAPMLSQAPNDQSAVTLSDRADMTSPKIAHGFGSGKATTYAARSAGNENDDSADNETANAAPAAPALAPPPQQQDQDADGDQPSAPNANDDDQYGPAYADNSARARARAWRRRLIEAYETYRRRSVPEDYYGDSQGYYGAPPPPPSRDYSGDDDWSNR